MIEADVEDYFSKLGYRPRSLPWNRLAGKIFRESQIGGLYGVEPLFRESVLESRDMRIALAGAKLEEVQMELNETLNQVDETKKQLQQSYNEMVTLANSLFPLMKSQIETMRTTRMTLQSESRDTLKALHEVRHFFLESNYEKEMERLEKFVRLCREFQELKAAGVLDDVADVSIRMAIREVGAK